MDQLETKLTHQTRFNPFKMTSFFFTQLEPNQFVMSKHKCGKQAGWVNRVADQVGSTHIFQFGKSCLIILKSYKSQHY